MQRLREKFANPQNLTGNCLWKWYFISPWKLKSILPRHLACTELVPSSLSWWNVHPRPIWPRANDSCLLRQLVRMQMFTKNIGVFYSCREFAITVYTAWLYRSFCNARCRANRCSPRHINSCVHAHWRWLRLPRGQAISRVTDLF